LRRTSRPDEICCVRIVQSDIWLRSVEIVNGMKTEDKPMGDRDRELFLGHMVTWGSIITGLILAITLTHFSAAEPEERASPTRAESPS